MNVMLSPTRAAINLMFMHSENTRWRHVSPDWKRRRERDEEEGDYFRSKYATLHMAWVKGNV